ncbi:MAG: outer membrane lipoprotein-sorting protein [Spirochaetales bacterium]|nr:outer membrane lipoprotein-sorting protein [Spirochaetales bacterium]
MKRNCILMALLFLSAAWTVSADEAALAVLKRMELIIYPDNFHVKNALTTTGPGKSGVPLVFDVFHKKDVGSVMTILSPARSKGIRFLERSNGLWMYNPKAGSGNAIRLSPRSSFQGSVFSNNDVSDPKYSDDYDVAFGRDETIEIAGLGKVACRVLECAAKTEVSPYARIRVWGRASDDLPLRMDFYARSGALFKRMTLSDVKHMAGRRRPSTITMVSLEEEGVVSTVTFEDMTVRNNLPDAMFTEAALTR